MKQNHSCDMITSKVQNKWDTLSNFSAEFILFFYIPMTFVFTHLNSFCYGVAQLACSMCETLALCANYTG